MPAASSTVVDRWRLPLREASALGLRRVAGSLELLSVDDDRYHLSRSALTPPLVVPREPTDVGPAFGVGSHARESNFEGVDADGRGRVFLLRENDAQVVVLSADLTRVERTIDLKVGDGALGRQWAADDNSRGEGLVLLDNGHLLIAKQRRDPWLIEFGPIGDEPAGFRPGLSVGPDDHFPLPGGDPATFGVLAAWPIAESTGLTSLNDLAVDDDGGLWAVSSGSACLARLRGPLTPDGRVPEFDTWRLPLEVVPDRDDRPKAEGLVRWPGRGWLVALDLDGRAPGRPNLVLLDGP